MQGILPEEAQSLLHLITEKNGQISDEVESILLKLWQGEKLTRHELALEITPSEVAAIWSITHKRPLSVTTVRQAVSRRKGAWKEPIKPSREWGSGSTLRRLYRLGDILDEHIQDRSRTVS